jgi:hypothetical protein
MDLYQIQFINPHWTYQFINPHWTCSRTQWFDILASTDSAKLPTNSYIYVKGPHPKHAH